MKKLFAFLIGTVLLALSISSCKEEPIGPLPPAPPPSPSFDFYKLSTPVKVEAIYSYSGEILSQMQDGACQVIEEAISATNSEFLLYNPEDKYIGQIFKGTEAIDNADWSPLLGGERNPLIFTVVGPTVHQASYEMDPPALHTYNDAMNTYKQQDVLMDAEAQFSFNILEINSKDKLKFDLNGQLKVGKWVDISAGISTTDLEEKNVFVVEMIQKHASVNASLPNDPMDLFHILPSLDKIGDWSPILLSSIEYGRAAYFIMKSSKSKSSSEKALAAAFKFLGKVNLNIELTQEEESILNSMETQAIIYGGAQKPALATVSGISGITDYVESGFLKRQAFGVPLSYKFKYLKDFSDAKVVSNLVYTYRDCEETDDAPTAVTKVLNIDNILDCSKFYPVHIGGDREFKGNGPVENASAEIYLQNNSRELWLHVYFNVKETKSDWTEGEVRERKLIYTAGANEKIRILSDKKSSCKGTDHGFSWNSYYQGLEELVEEFKIIGDTGGNDLMAMNGNNPCDDFASIEIRFNPVEIELIKI